MGINRFVQVSNEAGDYVPGGLGTLGPEDGVGGLDTVQCTWISRSLKAKSTEQETQFLTYIEI